MTEKPNLTKIHEFHVHLKEELHKCIVGYDDLMDLLTITLLSDGALLMEGVPGTAKTTLCKIFAQNIGGKFDGCRVRSISFRWMLSGFRNTSRIRTP